MIDLTCPLMSSRNIIKIYNLMAQFVKASSPGQSRLEGRRFKPRPNEYFLSYLFISNYMSSLSYFVYA